MKSVKSPHARSLASFRREAASAIRGHWLKTLSITLLLTLIMMLPISALMLILSYTPMPLVELYQHSEALNFLRRLSRIAALPAFGFFLLSPIQTVAQTRIGINLLFDQPVDLPVVSATRSEWGKALRVSFLGFFSSFWPLLAGLPAAWLLAQAGVSPLFSLLLLGALAAYSIIRFLSYYPAQYLLILFPLDNARTLLKTSRRIIQDYRKQFFLLLLGFAGWLLPALLLPSLLGLLPETLLSAQWLSAVIPVGWLITTLPLTVYFHTTVTAYILNLPYET